MGIQKNIDYKKMAIAIEYIRKNFKSQPTLDEIAQQIHMSSFHFQRLFSQWVGISPKKFLQFISVAYAKSLLEESKNNILKTTHKTGLSSAGRLHDLFVKIEGMTPWEYKNKWEGLHISYSYHSTIFGEILIASTIKWICFMWFSDDRTQTFWDLKSRFLHARFTQKIDNIQMNALKIYKNDWTDISKIKLHLKWTDFQLKVWESLLKIPSGSLSTYGLLAKDIDKPNAYRAVGTAIGKNPVSFLIPCHRVIQSSWLLGGYMWNPTRKMALIGWEIGKKEKSKK